jgi:AraC-like DNA-binding protein
MRKQWPREMYYKLSGTGISDVLELGRYEFADARFRINPHVHGPDRLEICYVVRGFQQYQIAGQTVPVRGGEAYVVFPGESHDTGLQPEQRGLVYFVIFRLREGQRSFLDLHSPEAPQIVSALLHLAPRVVPGSPALHQYLDAMFATMLQHAADPLRNARLRSYILAFVMELLSCAASRRQTGLSPRIAALLARIRAAPANPTRVSDMARELGLSVSRFTTVFERETGTSPGDYLLSCRVDAAREMIRRDPARPITDIAMELSFSSSQHFAVTFKRLTGATPSQFRLACAAEAQAGAAPRA